MRRLFREESAELPWWISPVDIYSGDPSVLCLFFPRELISSVEKISITAAEMHAKGYLSDIILVSTTDRTLFYFPSLCPLIVILRLNLGRRPSFSRWIPLQFYG